MSYTRSPLLETGRMNPFTGALPRGARGPATAVLASRGLAGLGIDVTPITAEQLKAYCNGRNADVAPDGQSCTCKKNYVEDPARDKCSVICKAGFHPDANGNFCLPDNPAGPTPSGQQSQPPDLFGNCPPGWSKDPVTGLLCLPPLWQTNVNLPCPAGTIRDPAGFACWPAGNIPFAMPAGGCPPGTGPDDLTGTTCVKNTLPGPQQTLPGSGTPPVIGPAPPLPPPPPPPPTPPPPPSSASAGVPIAVLGGALLLAGVVYVLAKKAEERQATA